MIQSPPSFTLPSARRSRKDRAEKQERPARFHASRSDIAAFCVSVRATLRRVAAST